jgi:putative DNA primase/helicase
MTGSRLDMASVRAMLAPRAAELAIALLGEPNRSMSGKREFRFGNHGSVSVVIAGPKAGQWFDHELGIGGDLFELIKRERGGNFRDAIEFAERFVGHAARDPAPARRVRRQRDAAAEDRTHDISRALAIWKEAVPIVGTIAASYLERQRHVLAPALDAGDGVLRLHPNCPFGVGTRHPCLVALLRDIFTNEPRAIQRIALTPDGEKIGRKTLGPKTGAAIKLTAHEDVADYLLIGEGLETTLSWMALGYRVAWAAGDAGELAQFPVLSGITSLSIGVDHDTVEKGERGQRAAEECSQRWRSAEREVFRLVPQEPGTDANDLLIARHLRRAAEAR